MRRWICNCQFSTYHIGTSDPLLWAGGSCFSKQLYWYCRAYLQGSKDATLRINKLIASPKNFREGSPA